MSLYIHTIPFAQVISGGTDLVFQATARREGRLFVNRTHDYASGRVHERYFSSLEEFVRWHYKALGYDVTGTEGLEAELIALEEEY